jgi:hypothetical protein
LRGVRHAASVPGRRSRLRFCRCRGLRSILASDRYSGHAVHYSGQSTRRLA